MLEKMKLEKEEIAKQLEKERKEKIDAELSSTRSNKTKDKG